VQHRLAKTLVAGRFDAIVTHGSWMHGIAARVVAKHGVPLVTWVHGIPSPKNRLDRQLIRWKPDLVIANSRHTARAMSAMLPESRIEVVYFPIEPPASSSSGEVRRRLRERLSLDESTCVILMASRMEEWKGHRVLIEAVDRLPLDRNFHVLIVGEPQKSTEVDYFDSLKKSAASGKHPQRIRFLGHRPDVRELMLAADIFCQPNTAPEPFGIVFIEALYAGLPIVTTGMGGGAEIVDATCGNLLDPGDTKALSDCLDEWIRFPARRNEFASHGPTRAHELCNPTKQFERLHSTISRVFISS
jgi:glycosyltransferase involved in cell wall biosynthesis